MTGGAILAIDQGTTNTKAILLSPDGSVVATTTVRVPLRFPRPGWVETDARALWDTVREAAAGCIADAPGTAVTAIAVANQRESVVAWDARTGDPLGPCVSWQCRRTAEHCDALRAAGNQGWVQARTGLGIDPMFSATKMRWLLDRVEDAAARAARREICVGTVDAWLVWNLTGGGSFATDLTNASRTQLLDLERRTWDPELAELFGVPLAALPEIRASNARFGESRAGAPFADGVPVAAAIGDSHAALFGHGAPPPGTVKATYGTGTSVLTAVSERVAGTGLSGTIAWATESRGGGGPIDVVDGLEGNIIATGAAVEWLASILGDSARPEAIETLAASTETTDGVYLVPAFAGLGAPHWDADARGLISGLTRGTTPAHIARAAYESIVFQVRDVFEVLRRTAPTPPSVLVADGGAIDSDLLAQLQADALQLPVLRSTSSNVAARGAGYLAGLATGTWTSLGDIRRIPRSFDRFDPGPGAESLENAYPAWLAALARSRGDAGVNTLQPTSVEA